MNTTITPICHTVSGINADVVGTLELVKGFAVAVISIGVTDLTTRESRFDSEVSDDDKDEIIDDYNSRFLA